MAEGKADLSRAYLLRCWREGCSAEEGEATWRFSLEEVGGARRRLGFMTLEALLAFLRAELGGAQAELSQ
ncbi:MAG: hypothetical protein M5U01_17045 [Ardenticatenaceae bacterium]|nr:hypothetical protein [Ardenticatenaceae bacterium]